MHNRAYKFDKPTTYKHSEGATMSLRVYNICRLIQIQMHRHTPVLRVCVCVCVCVCACVRACVCVCVPAPEATKNHSFEITNELQFSQIFIFFIWHWPSILWNSVTFSNSTCHTCLPNKSKMILY